MFSTLSTIRNNAGLRACALAIFFFGFSGAATAPYKSVVAIRELGLSDAGFSALTLAAAVINVTAAIYLGILADRDTGYRKLLMSLAFIGVAGYMAIFLFPSAWIFVISLLLPISVYHGLNSLLFGAGRVFSSDLPKGDQAAVSSVLRGLISLAWILVPGLVGFALSGAESLLPAFAIAGGSALVCMVVINVMMPRGGSGDPSQRPPRVSLGAAFRLLTRLPVAARVLGAAVITAMIHVNAAVMPLIVTGQAGGEPGDVGVIVGLVAALEVAFILVWARIVRSISIVAALAIGTGLYMIYLVWLAFALSPASVIAASVVGGVGAAALITLPLGYLQELIAERPGLSASLISVNIFLAGAIAAALFAIGTAIGDYPLVALLGAGAGALGALGLLVLEGWRLRAPL